MKNHPILYGLCMWLIANALMMGEMTIKIYMATLYHQISLYRKGVTYRRSKEFVNIFRESIVYPLVDMKEKDTGIFLLNNTHFVEILNYVQYSAMSCIKF